MKLGFTGVYIIFLLLLKNIDFGYTVSTIYVLSENKKNITIFHVKFIIFKAVKKSQYIAWACFRNVLQADDWEGLTDLMQIFVEKTSVKWFHALNVVLYP